jgi:hypothetical protein
VPTIAITVATLLVLFKLKLRARATAALPSLLVVACAPRAPEPTTDEASSALTADQCDFFDVNGKVRICHATGSSKHPFTVLDISNNACINAHANHAGDYVAVGDPTCHGGGCLPAGAPSDPSLPCCEDLVVQNGPATRGTPGAGSRRSPARARATSPASTTRRRTAATSCRR